MTQAIKVAIINDHPIVVAGFRALSSAQDQLEVVELDLGLPPAQHLDLALLDTFGLAAALPQTVRQLAQNPLVGKVVVVTWNVDGQHVREALAAGASGVVAKSLPQQDLVNALVAVHRGDTVTSVNSSSGSKDAEPDQRTGLADWPGRTMGLTMREAEMITMVCRGLSNQEIAQNLYLSSNTVKSYIRSAYRKIGAGSRSQAVLWGIEHGFRPAPRRLDPK